MKKILLLILSVVLAFSLISCGEEKTSDGNTSGSQTDTSSTDKSSDGGNADSDDSAEKVTLTLYNTTQFDFTSIAISRIGANKWGENLINGTLKSRENTPIKISVPDEDPIFDVQAKATNGEVYVFQFLDLSELTSEGGNIHLALTEGGGGFAQFSPQE